MADKIVPRGAWIARGWAYHMEMTSPIEMITRYGVLPLVTLDHTERALALADALAGGGLPLVEVAFRTPVAADVIRAIRDERAGMCIGAGTVLTAENLRAAKKAGAAFALSPGLNTDIVKLAGDLGLPLIPGVCTPSEIEKALSLGCSLLKFFPAQVMGGVRMVRALVGPYQHTGLKLIPTGGIGPENMQEYVRCPLVAAVGGTWIAPSEDLIHHRWTQITQRCQTAVRLVNLAREQPAATAG